MGEDVRDASELGKTSDTDSRAEVVSEDKEGRSGDLEEAVVGEAVHDGAHGMLTDTEVKILSGVRLVKASAPVSTVVDVVAARSVEVGRAGNVVGNKLGNLLDDLVAGNAGSFGILNVEVIDLLDHFLGGHDVISDSVLELLGKVAISIGPGLVGGLPLVVGSLVLLLNTLEEVTGFLRDVPLLTLGDANIDLGFVNVRDAGLSVGSVGALCLLHALADDGVALDELRLAVVGSLSSGDGGLDGLEVVAINIVSLPPVGLVTLDDILRLGVLSHLVKGDLVGIVKDDKVIKLLVSGEAGGLGGDTLLEAAIAGEGVDVVVEDGVVIGVVDAPSHLGRGGKADSIGDTLSEGAGGGLNTGSGVLRVGELGVTGGLGVVLTEVLDLVHGEIKASKVQPGIKEHGSVTSGKDEAVTVDPGGVLGVVGHLGSVKGGTNLGSAKGKTHVAGFSGGNGVHGKATGLVGRSSEGSLGVNIDSSGLEGAGSLLFWFRGREIMRTVRY